MALDDVDNPGSRGWWFKTLAKEQFGRLQDLTDLRDRYEGNPPLPEGAESAREAFTAFQKKARSNYAEMVVEAVRNRQTPVGFRNAVAPAEGDTEETSDAAAAALWRANEMAVESADVLEFSLSMRDGYTMIGPPNDDSDGQAVITAEDPRQVITSQDPLRQSRSRAALKMFFDEDLEQDVAYLYLPAGQPQDNGRISSKATIHKATRAATKASSIRPRARFSPGAWTWAANVTELPTRRCPVVRFRNRHGMAEFEPHIDLLDRINHTHLQGMVLVTMQAYRQRAAKGMPSVYPEGHPLAGQEIDYEGIFTADPGAIWLLPETAEMWESGTGDIAGVLSMSKDHRQELAAVSFTPFYNFNAEVANGSAAGAQIQREGLVFKVEDRNTRAGIAFDLTNSIAFEMMGDADRAKPGALETMWAPVERFSLAEKYDAAVKAKAAGMSRRSIFIEVLQFTPAKADRMLRETADDFLFDAAAGSSATDLVAALAAAKPGA